MRSKKRWAAFLLCAAMVLPAEVYAKELNTEKEMMTTEEGQTQIGLEMTSQIEGNESDVLLYRAGETKKFIIKFHKHRKYTVDLCQRDSESKSKYRRVAV